MLEGPTIGVLVDWLDDAYHAAVLTGIVDAARQADANLVCFAGTCCALRCARARCEMPCSTSPGRRRSTACW